MGSRSQCHSNVGATLRFCSDEDFYLICDRYVFWDQHEKVEGVYDFEGINDLVGFIEQAQEIGFLVILRVGP